MPTTYTPLATTTLNSNQSSVTFSGISGAYTDLVLVVNAYQNSNTPVYLRVNGLTTSIYSNTWIRGDGTTATTGRYNTAALGGSGLNLDNFSALPPFPSNFSGQATYHIMNYSNTTTNKTVLLRHGSSNWTIANVGLIQTTSAITSLEIYPFGTTWASGSTFSLYGIASAAVVSGVKATGGDVVATDGTYWYHAFRASGTFTPTQALTADVLVVAGGGGGGCDNGGGGGAGGLLAFNSQSLTATNYTVTVGAGGAGGIGTAGSTQGVTGSDSQFASLTLVKGGGGGGGRDEPGGSKVGKNGGSGGGGANAGAGGTATSGQGNNGGSSSFGGATSPAAGGGGAGAVGQNAIDSNNAGSGGVGSTTYSSWGGITGTGQNSGGTYYFAGGGGGAIIGGTSAGSGGLGGGGAGGRSASGTAGTAGTGGGGGGATFVGGAGVGGAGGSGIVIVRYAV